VATHKFRAQPGQRTADDDPDIGSVSINKEVDSFDQITIKGSNKRISAEEFGASTSFVDLEGADIVPNSESVYDDADGTNFVRGDDYEMDFSAGEIKALSTGDLDTTESYKIDYGVEVAGSFPEISSPAREFVDTVPAVTRDVGAEQIAFALFDDDAENPRYAGDLTIPQSDVSFDPLEALSLDNLDLPAAATPLAIRGEPEISPTGIRLRLGSRSRVEESLADISETVRAVSRKT
jgi:hypothetical protein